MEARDAMRFADYKSGIQEIPRRKPDELSREELVAVVQDVLESLYGVWGDGAGRLDPDRE
jgi:hypothetical protein